eukprot:4748408-Alexandrium_andersonii.AAC.1
MSASLVGSEMCIRDRYTFGAGRVGLLAIYANCGQRAWRAQLFRLGSVSYTHLTLPTICSV